MNTAYRRKQSDKHYHGDLTCPIFLPTGRDAELVCDSCRRHGISSYCCKSFQEFMETVQKGSGPVIIADDAVDDDGWRQFQNLLAAEPDWSELPVLILCQAEQCRSDVIRELSGRRSVTLLVRPTDESSLLNVIKADIETRRRQYQVRGLLVELRRVNEDLDKRVSQLRHLALALTQAEEDERRRVAHALHDELQQLLAAARVSLGQLMPVDDTAESGEAEVKAVRRIDAILKDAIQSSRMLSRDLSPPLLYQAGLGPALEQLAERMLDKYNLRVEVKYSKNTVEIDENLRAFLFEAARELLFNVTKYAGTAQAYVKLKAIDGSVALSVIDKGRGFDPAKLDSRADHGPGFGLFGIRERTDLLGGKFNIDSQPGRGTRITIVMPRTMPSEGVAGAGRLDEEAVPIGEIPKKKTPEIMRVLVVDDHRVMRDGLVAMLDDIPEIEVVGEADDGRSALEAVRTLAPDVVLMDVSLPDMTGIEVTRRIRLELQDTEIIGLSMFKDAAIADQMLEAGASAYLVKSGPTESLISAILACRESQ